MNNALFPDTVAVKPTFVKTKLYAGLALRQRADLLYWPIFRLTNLAFLRAKAIPREILRYPARGTSQLY